MESKHEIIVFNSSSTNAEFQIYLDSNLDTVWVTQAQLTELFGKAKGTISEHIKNIFSDGELEPISTVRDFRIVQKEGSREIQRDITHYNLDVVISVGYRVKSKEGIAFRKWATKKLKEHLIKGYTINQQIQKSQIIELKTQLNHLHESVIERQTQLTDGLLSIISNYSKTFELLNQYDTDDLSTNNLERELNYIINYEDVKKAIES